MRHWFPVIPARLKVMVAVSASAAVLSGCVPAAGKVSYVIGSEGSSYLTISLEPRILSELSLRPRSSDDERDPQEMLSRALTMVSEDPDVCSGLLSMTGASGLSVTADEASITCSLSLLTGENDGFAVDARVPVGSLWDLRERLARALLQLGAEGYAEVPQLGYPPSSDADAAGVEKCRSGSVWACYELYYASEPGTAAEVEGLIGIRSDLVGEVPEWVYEALPLAVEVSVAAPHPVISHNGSLVEGSFVSWAFDTSDPGQIRTGMMVEWSVPEPAPDRTSALRTAALVAFIAGIATLSLTAVRRIWVHSKNARSRPKTKTLSTPKRRRTR